MDVDGLIKQLQELRGVISSQAATALRESQLRVAALEAERREQLDMLFSVGPITCRDGKQHDPITDECVYCVIDALKAENASLKSSMQAAYNQIAPLQTNCDCVEEHLQKACEILWKAELAARSEK